MSISASVALTCSWADADLSERTAHLSFEEGGMEAAEGLVQAALHNAPAASSSVLLADTTAAPWLEARLGPFGIVALCLVANARVLEIHEATESNSVSAAPLLTQEAQLTDPMTGLHAHFLCHGSGGALLPPHHAYRLKLFGRSPRERVCVALICLVMRTASPEIAPTPPPPSLAPQASATAESAVAEALFGLQRQFVLMERRIGVALDDVNDRLGRLERRVDHLEVPAAAAFDEEPMQRVGGDDSEDNVEPK